jgi:hypothetical protein
MFGVPTNLVGEGRMRAAKAVQGCHVDDGEAAGLEDAPHLRHGRALGGVIQAIQDVERGRDVHAGVRKGQGRYRALHEAPAADSPESEANGRSLEADRPA